MTDAIPSNNGQVKTCPRCGLYFECKVSDINNCQCRELMLTEEVTNFISNNYSNCLCSNCLQELIKAGTDLTSDQGL